MKELSLNILDVAQNSVKAKATVITVELIEEGNELTFRITDDGVGMTPEFLANVLDPFTTTRTTRRVGLGLPLLKMAAEATGGYITVTSRDAAHHEDHGTVVTAVFRTDHIDCPPLGDIASTMVMLIQNAPFAPRYIYRRSVDGNGFVLDTDELHASLGEDVPLSEPEVLAFVGDYIREGEEEIENK